MSSEKEARAKSGVYQSVIYHERQFMKEIRPCIHHSIYDIENFYFTNRLDTYSIIEPGKKALFFDVGKDQLCGKKFIDEVVERYEIPWSEVEVFVSHFHDDHDDNLGYCLKKGATRFYHGPHIPFSRENCQKFLVSVGAVREKDDEPLAMFAGFLMCEDRHAQEIIDHLIELPEGHVLQVGDYNFEVLYTPGHTPEHASLLERDKRFLFAGDHILNTAPGLMQFYPDIHLLTRFFESLRYIQSLELETVYMSHTDSIQGADAVYEFIEGIFNTYKKPLAKTIDILGKKKATTLYDLARDFYSYLPGGIAAQEPMFRVRRLAIPLAYVEHLCDQGIAERLVDDDGCFVYRYRG